METNDKIERIDDEIYSHYKAKRLKEENQAISRMKTDSLYFFSYAKKFSEGDNFIPDLRDKDKKLVSDDKSKTEILSDKYTTIWSNPFSDLKVDEHSDLHGDCKYCENETTHICEDDISHEVIENFKKKVLHISDDVEKHVYMNLNYKTEVDFIKIIEKLPSKAAIGPDGISVGLMKRIKLPLSRLLSLLYNSSLDEGHFPDILKYAFIIGIFKSWRQD